MAIYVGRGSGTTVYEKAFGKWGLGMNGSEEGEKEKETEREHGLKQGKRNVRMVERETENGNCL